MIRKAFEKELDLLKEKLVNMESKVEVALKNSIEALHTQNLELAEEIIDGDEHINQLELEIEELIIKIIAAQQPVAIDLRKIISTLKVTTSVERIGDFAVDIAKTTKRIGKQELIKPLEDIPKMGEVVLRMIKLVIQAFIKEDDKLALEAAAMDDEVDKMYSNIVKELLDKMMVNPDEVEQVLLLAYVARYLERVADHTTNIAEAVLYIVKGQRVDLN